MILTLVIAGMLGASQPDDPSALKIPSSPSWVIPKRPSSGSATAPNAPNAPNASGTSSSAPPPSSPGPTNSVPQSSLPSNAQSVHPSSIAPANSPNAQASGAQLVMPPTPQPPPSSSTQDNSHFGLWEQGGVQAPQQPDLQSRAAYTSVERALAGKLSLPGGNFSSRIGQIAGVRGLEDNVVFGVGLVVGLAATGDTIDAAKALLQNVLLTRNVHVDLQQLASKNVAIVQVEARLPAGLKPGRKLDVTVSAIGDATSLTGGTLVFTELSDPSGRNVYATASGPVNTGGFQATGQAATAKKNQTTVATLPEGGKVEREVPTSIISDNGIVYLDLNVERAGLGNAMRVASSVNALYPGTAIALSDGRSVEVHVPLDLPASEVVAFVHGILAREVEVETVPRVVLNERTGTIVLGGDVRLRAGAIAHGSITVTIAETPVTSQPGPFSSGSTVVTPRTSLDVTEDKGKLVMIPGAVTLREVVEVLDVLGATPRELVSIIEAMSQGGLLEAEIRRM